MSPTDPDMVIRILRRMQRILSPPVHQTTQFPQKKNSIISDEAQFNLSCIVSKLNFRIWATEKPGMFTKALSKSNVLLSLYLGHYWMWFQQDCETSNTARQTMALLQELFPARTLSRNGNISWPPRSPNLTAPDFFICGFLKKSVYRDKPRTLAALKDKIDLGEGNATCCATDSSLSNVNGGHMSNVVSHEYTLSTDVQ
ncbi:hypothetical protein PR048_017118 [Dryococelus australis]|uniref:Uncharacterized protein n=1 Tax=Dryococelus australis TaxID=614101 RepID=A0ABQ9H8M6_9NEOP|nr:hypothetical protein PR048_017118 [Dryococelus australis]